MNREPDARKIDAECAEKIFGWHRVIMEEQAVADEIANRFVWRPDYVGSFNGKRTVVPAYSADMTDAMAVLEKATAIRILSGLPQSGYEVSIWFIRNGETSFGRARSDSLPMAICLAALRAIGAERKDCGVQQKGHTDHKEKNE